MTEGFADTLARLDRDVADPAAWRDALAFAAEDGASDALVDRLERVVALHPEAADLGAWALALGPSAGRAVGRLQATLERRVAALRGPESDPERLAEALADLGAFWESVVGHPDEALTAYRSAITQSARCVRALYAARQLLRARGELNEVAKLYELEALAEPVRARKAALLAELGHLLIEAFSNYRAAVEVLDRAHSLAPENAVATRMLAYAMLRDAELTSAHGTADTREVVASLYYALAADARPEEALTYAEEALTALPAHEPAMALLERTAAELGREDLLPQRWVAYLEAAPTTPLAPARRRRLAQAYIDHKQPMDAIACLEPLVERGDPEAAGMIASLYRKLGRDDAAASALARSLAGLPAEERVARLREILHLRVDSGGHEPALVAAREILELAPADEAALDLVEAELRRAGDLTTLRQLLLRAAEAPNRSTTERRRRLAEVAVLEEDGLGDPASAIRTWEASRRLDPHDPAPRLALERLYANAGRWVDLAAHLDEATTLTTATDERARIFLALADVLEEHLGDPKEAARALRSYRALCPLDREARARLTRLLLRTGGYVEAVALLRAQIDEAADPAERLELLRTHAALLEERVEDPEAAYEAWTEVLEAAPEDRAAIESIVRIDERLGRWDRLVDALAYETELATPTEQVRLLRRMGEILEHELGELERAADCYAQAMVIAPEDESLLDALGRCYARAGRHRDLLEVLHLKAKRAEAPNVRASLHRRIARLLEEELGNAAAAREAWERVLADAPDNTEALRHAVETARRAHEDARLVPLLERLETVVGTLEERIELRLERADVLTRLGRTGDACAIVEDAAAHLAPTHLGILDWLVAHHEARSAYDALAGALERHLEADPDPITRQASARRLADIREHRLRDLTGAVRVLTGWCALVPGDPEPHRRLAAALERGERWSELRAVFDTLSDIDSPRGARHARLRAAELSATLLADPRGAFTRVEGLARAGDPEALALLERVERNDSVAPEAAELRWRQASAETDPARRKALLLGAAQLYEVSPFDVDRAFEATRAALELDPSDEAVLVLLERRAKRARRTDELRPLLERTLDELVRGVSRATSRQEKVDALVAAARFAWRSLANEALFAEMLAKAVEQSELDEPLLAQIERACLAIDTPANHTPLEMFVAELGRVAELPVTVEDDGLRAEILRRAARILAVQLGAPHEAVDVLMRASVVDAGREAILDELEHAARRAGRLRDYDRHLDALARDAVDALPAAVALRRRADLLVHLGRLGDAVRVLEQLWLIRPRDRAIPLELAECLRQTDRPQELAAVLERLLEERPAALERVALLRELGQLWQHALKNPWEATRAWQQLLRLAPGDAEATAALARITAEREAEALA